MPAKALIRLTVYDGTRKPVRKRLKLLVTLRDGNQDQLHRDWQKGPSIEFEGPFSNSLADNYTVIVFANGYLQAGFAPVKVSTTTPRIVDLMILPKRNQFSFYEARWGRLRNNHPMLFNLLVHGASNQATAKNRYEEFMEEQAGSLAALLNITTAMKHIQLPVGNSLSYFKELIWDKKSMKRDRFFAYADVALVAQVSITMVYPPPEGNLTKVIPPPRG